MMDSMETTGVILEAEDVQARAELAKLDTADLLQPVQMLQFSMDASDQNVLLVQLDKDLVKSIETGKELVIRGYEDDTAVLCTEDATYSIKKAIISNAMILLDECTVGKENKEPSNEKDLMDVVHRNAVTCCSSYFELKQIYPNTARLRKLLQQSMYKGPSDEDNLDSTKLYTLSDLVEIIQASEEEIVSYLCNINSCCIAGNWRLLDFTYTVKSMEHIFQVIEAESWPYTQVPIDKLCETVNDSGELVPSFIIKHLLGCYGTKFTSEQVDYIKFDEKKICCFFAEMLLREVSLLRLTDFLEVMKEALPMGMVFDESHLTGVAIIDHSGKESSIKLFMSEELPVDVEARIDALFLAKAKWAYEEIAPYIQDVCLANQSASSVLTKYARTSTSKDGKKIFTSRKPCQ